MAPELIILTGYGLRILTHLPWCKLRFYIQMGRYTFLKTYLSDSNIAKLDYYLSVR